MKGAEVRITSGRFNKINEWWDNPLFQEVEVDTANWAYHGLFPASPVMMVRLGPSKFDMYARGHDGIVRMQRNVNSTWLPGPGLTNWTPISSANTLDQAIGNIAAVSRYEDQVDLFMRQKGSSGLEGPKPICTKARSPWGWWPSETTWACFGDISSVESPAAVSTGAGRLSVFGTGSDGRVTEKSWDDQNGWAYTPVDIAGNTQDPMSVVTRSSSVWDLFIRDATDGQICTKARLGSSYWPSQYQWVCMGSPQSKIDGAPIAVAAGPNELHVFGISARAGYEGQIVHYMWYGGWATWAGPEYLAAPWYNDGAGWYSLGFSSIAVVSRSQGYLDLFARERSSGRIFNRWGGGSAWNFAWNGSWFALQGNGVDISAVSTGSNRLDIVTRYRNDLAVRHRWWYGNGWLP